ncbi:hypothetical protein Y032_0205g1911 [Ancylostoma ceylanicum]|uniref:Uncharacterized protein n=1 Tax=Ancylostoma ceylanicum TaxID=53326 RepID=A0A016SLG0_9BILA|nr:hypothetical protein Y032_0205g1911 [Ancylostoma ceylanicum]
MDSMRTSQPVDRYCKSDIHLQSCTSQATPNQRAKTFQNSTKFNHHGPKAGGKDSADMEYKSANPTGMKTARKTNTDKANLAMSRSEDSVSDNSVDPTILCDNLVNPGVATVLEDSAVEHEHVAIMTKVTPEKGLKCVEQYANLSTMIHELPAHLSLDRLTTLPPPTSPRYFAPASHFTPRLDDYMDRTINQCAKTRRTERDYSSLTSVRKRWLFLLLYDCDNCIRVLSWKCALKFRRRYERVAKNFLSNF